MEVEVGCGDGTGVAPSTDRPRRRISLSLKQVDEPGFRPPVDDAEAHDYPGEIERQPEHEPVLAEVSAAPPEG